MFKKVIDMQYFLKITGLVITLTAATAMAPRLLAQATAQTPLATQLGVSVHPKNNQDHGQQAKDENECYSLAKQQTVDPAAAPPQQAQDAKGSGAKGVAKGAESEQLAVTPVRAQPSARCTAGATRREPIGRSNRRSRALSLNGR